MSEDQTQRLIAGLAADREPVRRRPRLRVVAGAVFAASGLVLVYSMLAHGVRSDWLALFPGDASYSAILLGLIACGAGATLAALAGAVPGREDVVRRGALFAAIGLSLGALVALLGVAMGAGQEAGRGGAIGDDWMCLRSALQMSPLPVAAVLFAVSRGWVGRPGLAAATALAGAAATGALGIHLACGLIGARHFLLGHVSAPVLLALVLCLPATTLLRRLAR